MIIHLCTSLFLVVSMTLTNTVGNYATHRTYINNIPPLFDVLHELFPPISPLIVDISLLIVNGSVIILCCYHSYIKKTLRYFDTLCLTIDSLYLLRCLCIYTTYLPPPVNCEFEDTTEYWTVIRKDFCGDLMFSGHTFQFAVGCIYIYLLYPNNWIKIIGSLATIIYGILVSVSRLHYTIDIIVAIITTLLIHQNVEYYYNRLLIRSNATEDEGSS